MPRLMTLAGYSESVAALGNSAEVWAAIKALLDRLERHPEGGAFLEAPFWPAQVVRTTAQEGIAPLRIVYVIQGDAVLVYHVRRYDVLEYQQDGLKRGDA